MPIVVSHTSGADEANLAFSAGAAQGRADRMSQQRQIDASLTSQMLSQKHDLKRIGMAQGFERERMKRDDQRQQDSMTIALEKLKLEAQDDAGRRADAQKKQRALAEDQAVEAANRRQMQAAVESQYEGRPKDMTYEVAMNQIRTEGKLSDRLVSALGVENAVDTRARLKAEMGGTVEQFAPQSVSERRSRRQLEIGDFEGVGQRLSQNLDPDDDGYNDFVDAGIQLQGWAQVTDDPAVLQTALEDLKGQGVPDNILEPIQKRIDEIEIEQVGLKAPSVLDMSLENYQQQSMAMSEELGRPLSAAEQSRVLGASLGRQLASSGLSPERFENWVNSQEDTRTAATKMTQRVMAQQQAMHPMGGDEPTGSEESMGADAPIDESLMEFPDVIVENGRVTYPDYLVPRDPNNPRGAQIDTRSGRVVTQRMILARYMPEIRRQLLPEVKRIPQGAGAEGKDE